MRMKLSMKLAQLNERKRNSIMKLAQLILIKEDRTPKKLFRSVGSLTKESQKINKHCISPLHI